MCSPETSRFSRATDFALVAANSPLPRRDTTRSDGTHLLRWDTTRSDGTHLPRRDTTCPDGTHLLR